MCYTMTMTYQACGHEFTALQVCGQPHPEGFIPGTHGMKSLGVCGSRECFEALQRDRMISAFARIPPFFSTKEEALAIAALIESRAEAFLASTQPILDLNGKDILSDDAVVSSTTGFLEADPIKAFRVFKIAMQISWVENGLVLGKATELYLFLNRVEAHVRFMYEGTMLQREESNLPLLLIRTPFEDIGEGETQCVFSRNSQFIAMITAERTVKNLESKKDKNYCYLPRKYHSRRPCDGVTICLAAAAMKIS
ncbi:hypothetical protein HYFRA_00013820 [Hymenoscyphus fraxineus]|uniref:Uncharacterized protein n=1 Tax=Hymenoscyphus fraxineus TaxID=746836 RepID=A0A9N9L947_9HELO|nr:hypothetical protein HYFRA_00013820 [Hymenoscyphus fraxineus]